MNDLKFTGKITFKSKEIEVGAEKQASCYIIFEEMDVQYPNKFLCGFYSTLAEEARALKVGEVHTVLYSFRVNESKDRHFMNANARRIVKKKKIYTLEGITSPTEDLPF